MRALKPVAAVLFVLLLASCSGIPDGVKAVTGFKPDRYLGHWYEIVRLDHRFERHMTNVTATYSRNRDGSIRVVNRGFYVPGKKWKQAVGKARFVSKESVGRLKVSFFGPFYAGYNIIALDHRHYRYAMVSGPSRKYFWILARTPKLDPAIKRSLIARARKLGYPVDQVINVKHDYSFNKHTGKSK